LPFDRLQFVKGRESETAELCKRIEMGWDSSGWTRGGIAPAPDDDSG
jgi:hypothetical protein